MNWANYLIQINLYLVLFYGFYLLFLKNETFFSLNRTYLVGSALSAMIIPLLRANWVKDLFITEQVQNSWTNVNVVMMQGFASPIAKDNTWVIGDYLAFIYLTIVSLLIIKLLVRLFKVNKLLKSETTLEAFSFFKRIKINPTLPHQNQIEKHELTHVKQLHSADVIFFEIICIINWFNPISFFYKKSVKHIHEFIADEEAVKLSESKSDYAMLLFSKNFGLNPNQLTNNFFNQSLLKRRIKMLQKPKSRKTAILKYGLSVPLFLLAIILSSAKISENKTIDKISEAVKPKLDISEIIAPKELKNLVKSSLPAIQKNDLTKFKSFEKDTVPKTKKADINYQLNEVKISASQSDEDPVYQNVEVLPSFPGGLENFGKFLRDNLKYPKKAKDEKIEGRVYAQFVVERDGRLTGIRIVRGIGGGCDEEAVRVLAISPKWSPGKQNGKTVRVSYTVPIFFQLNKKVSININKTNNESMTTNIEGENLNIIGSNFHWDTDKEPLIILNSNEIKKENLDKIDPNVIALVNVLKDDSAIKKYGDKGKNGVIEITTKKKE